jgi:ABC-type multidrug transport system permease subunit
MNMQRVLALAAKELRRVYREPAILFMVIVFPIMLTVAFGATFGALGGGGDSKYTVGVVNFDSSATPWAGAFKKGISDTGVLVVSDYSDNSTALKDLLQGNIDAVIVIPVNFGASIESFRLNPSDPGDWTNSTIGLSLDRGSMIVSAAVPSIVQRVLSTTIYGDGAASAPQPVRIGDPAMVASSQFTQFDYMVPGLYAYAAIFITMTVAQAFTTEREQGLLRRIAVTPTTSSEIFMSQILANLATGTLQVAIVYVAAKIMGFYAAGGAAEIAYAFVIVLLLVACNIGFGLITASLVKSSGAATGLSFLFILPQMLLGTFVPAPQSVGRLVPSYYVTDALTSIFLRGAPLTSPTVIFDLAIVALISIAVLIVGVIAFSRFGRS